MATTVEVKVPGLPGPGACHPSTDGLTRWGFPATALVIGGRTISSVFASPPLRMTMHRRT